MVEVLIFLIFDFLAFVALCARDQAPISDRGKGSSPEATAESRGPEQSRAEPVVAPRVSAEW